MKKLILLFLLNFCILAYLCARDTGKKDDGTAKKDSSEVTSAISKRAEEVLTTVFRPVPDLNNADSIVREYDRLPSFGIYKNNYIVTGTAIAQTPERDNSDAKFQISVSQRLTNSVLPLKSYLFLTYTQLAFWDIYKESFPFGDINFNPTIGLGKALAYNNRFLGTISFQVEHESNGRDGDESRSWNKISFSTLLLMDNNWTVQGKLWVPLVDGENNRDIVCYKGFAHFAVDYNTNNKKFRMGTLLTKRAGSFWDNNVTVNVSYRIFKNENQYLFAEYYNGYGENLLYYDRYRHRIRIGFVIQPSLLHVY